MWLAKTLTRIDTSCVWFEFFCRKWRTRIFEKAQHDSK